MASWKRTGVSTKEIYQLYKEKGGTLPYMKYKEIVGLFHKKVTDKIVSIGYEFELPYHNGLLKIIQVKRKYTVLENGNIRGSVNWGESNKIKAELIANGELPLVVYKEKFLKTGDNGGKPWLVYYTSPTYFVWAFIDHIYQKNWANYTFDIADGNIDKMVNGTNEKSYLLFKLKDNDKDGNTTDYYKLRNPTANTKQVQTS